MDICGRVRASSRQIQRPVGMSSAHMRTEHARSQPKTPCMSLASSTHRAINLFRILNCRFHMNEQEVAKIRHRMAKTCYDLKFDPKHPVVGLECAAQMGTHERVGRSTQVRRHGSSGRRSVSCRSKPGCLRPPGAGAAGTSGSGTGVSATRVPTLRRSQTVVAGGARTPHSKNDRMCTDPQPVPVIWA